jgi:hypothetical protein
MAHLIGVGVVLRRSGGSGHQQAAWSRAPPSLSSRYVRSPAGD